MPFIKPTKLPVFHSFHKTGNGTVQKQYAKKKDVVVKTPEAAAPAFVLPAAPKVNPIDTAAFEASMLERKKVFIQEPVANPELPTPAPKSE